MTILPACPHSKVQILHFRLIFCTLERLLYTSRSYQSRYALSVLFLRTIPVGKLAAGTAPTCIDTASAANGKE